MTLESLNSYAESSVLMLIDHYVDMYVCMLTLRIMLLTVGKIKESIPKKAYQS